METHIYKGYFIRIKKESNKFRAISRGAGQEYLDETPEEALAGVKRKIDNIEVWQEIQNMNQK